MKKNKWSKKSEGNEVKKIGGMERKQRMKWNERDREMRGK